MTEGYYFIYKGDYLNGEKNGKGKEYDAYDRLIFEGDYLNGVRNGKGKVYYCVRLLFEGECLNGRKKVEKEKNMMRMANYYLKENIIIVID